MSDTPKIRLEDAIASRLQQAAQQLSGEVLPQAKHLDEQIYVVSLIRAFLHFANRGDELAPILTMWPKLREIHNSAFDDVCAMVKENLSPNA